MRQPPLKDRVIVQYSDKDQKFRLWCWWCGKTVAYCVDPSTLSVLQSKSKHDCPETQRKIT
jgi:hypothetical protein